jgi:predicted transcriptional regulator
MMRRIADRPIKYWGELADLLVMLPAEMRARRAELLLEQKDVARLLRTTQQNVSRWERGRVFPEYVYVARILRWLDMDDAEVFERLRDRPLSRR